MLGCVCCRCFFNLLCQPSKWLVVLGPFVICTAYSGRNNLLRADAWKNCVCCGSYGYLIVKETTDLQNLNRNYTTKKFHQSSLLTQHLIFCI
jgi:hypothetical protein